jgi:hypothetical protein
VVPVIEEVVVEAVETVVPVIEEVVVEAVETVVPVIEEVVVEAVETVVPVIEEVVVEAVETVVPVIEEIAEEVVETVAPLVLERLFYLIPPQYMFIIPYRDREVEKDFFIKHMRTIMEDYAPISYRFLFIHQTDTRLFNRGAMKNIGFITLKMQFPTQYQNVNLIFNDVDTMPSKKNLLNYETRPGVAKHFYGFRFALGGIVSMKAIDFERCNGFPNFFGYAYEDNLLYKRCQNFGIDIDRSNFFPIRDPQILQSGRSGPFRTIKKSEFDRFVNNTTEGIYQLYQLKYTIEQINNNSAYVNVHQFVTPYPDNPAENQPYDIRVTSQPFRPTKSQIRNGIQPFMKMKFI